MLLRKLRQRKTYNPINALRNAGAKTETRASGLQTQAKALSFQPPPPVCSLKRSETVWPRQENLGQLHALAMHREAKTLEGLFPQTFHLLVEDKGSLS